jgi:hypothetical protein
MLTLVMMPIVVPCYLWRRWKYLDAGGRRSADESGGNGGGPGGVQD